MKASSIERGSYVYLMAADGEDLVKIGKANTPAKRLGEVQVGCPFKLRVFGLFETKCSDDAFAIERVAHEIFAASRKSGEWFRVEANTAFERMRKEKRIRELCHRITDADGRACGPAQGHELQELRFNEWVASLPTAGPVAHLAHWYYTPGVSGGGFFDHGFVAKGAHIWLPGSECELALVAEPYAPNFSDRNLRAVQEVCEAHGFRAIRLPESFWHPATKAIAVDVVDHRRAFPILQWLAGKVPASDYYAFAPLKFWWGGVDVPFVDDQEAYSRAGEFIDLLEETLK